MIRQITKAVQLQLFLKFGVARARRSPSVPTQAPIMKPFSINFLHDNPGASRKPKRVGRGPGSGKGKFAGRGMKGDKARSGGGVPVRFEGGQNPLTRKFPKYGRVKKKYAREFLNTVNMHQIVYFIKKGIINPAELITVKILHDVGLAKKMKYGVKILGKGLNDLQIPINVEVTDASRSIIEKIKSLGGTVRLIYRTPLKLKEHLFPEKFSFPLTNPLPPAYRVKKLDRISKNRGHEVEYRKPQWKIQEQEAQKKIENDENKFIYPVPRTPQPKKIHKRKAKLYRRISYQL